MNMWNSCPRYVMQSSAVFSACLKICHLSFRSTTVQRSERGGTSEKESRGASRKTSGNPGRENHSEEHRPRESQLGVPVHDPGVPGAAGIQPAQRQRRRDGSPNLCLCQKTSAQQQGKQEEGGQRHHLPKQRPSHHPRAKNQGRPDQVSGQPALSVRLCI